MLAAAGAWVYPAIDAQLCARRNPDLLAACVPSWRNIAQPAVMRLQTWPLAPATPARRTSGEVFGERRLIARGYRQRRRHFMSRSRSTRPAPHRVRSEAVAGVWPPVPRANLRRTRSTAAMTRLARSAAAEGCAATLRQADRLRDRCRRRSVACPGVCNDSLPVIVTIGLRTVAAAVRSTAAIRSRMPTVMTPCATGARDLRPSPPGRCELEPESGSLRRALSPLDAAC